MNVQDRLNAIENGWKPQVFKTVLEDGTIEFRNTNAQLHNDADLPAVIKKDGSKIWYKNGKKHRDNDLPALIWFNGIQLWYQNGQLYRDNDMPAVIYSNGEKEYWEKGFIIKYN